MPPYSDELVTWCRANVDRARSLEAQLVGHIVAHLADPKSSPSSLALSVEAPEEERHLYELAACYGFAALPPSHESSALFALGPTPAAMPKCSLVRAAHGGQRPAAEQSSERFAHSMLRVDRKRATALAAPAAAAPRDTTGDYVVALPPRRRAHASQFSVLGAADDGEARTEASVVASLRGDDVCCVCLEPLLHLGRARVGEALALLQCRHVLHESCSRAVLGAQGAAANGRTTTRCPMCRAESPYATKVHLQVRSSRGAPVEPAPAASSAPRGGGGGGGGGAATAQAKGKKKKKNAVFDDDPQVFELQAMGFDLETARNALEASGGVLARAVEFLLVR